MARLNLNTDELEIMCRARDGKRMRDLDKPVVDWLVEQGLIVAIAQRKFQWTPKGTAYMRNDYGHENFADPAALERASALRNARKGTKPGPRTGGPRVGGTGNAR